MSLIYVTALINIDCQESHKTREWRIHNFKKLLEHKKSDPLHDEFRVILLYDPIYEEDLADLFEEHSNICHMPFDYKTESWIYQASLPFANKLPDVRNEIKDTFLFLCLMNMKIEILAKAANLINDESDTYRHFAWIDFNLPHVFKRTDDTIDYMHYLLNQQFTPKFIAASGCWNIDAHTHIDFNHVNWRFCGGFLIGDADSILYMYDLYKNYYVDAMTKQNRITWEVNMWAYLEKECGLDVVWFEGNHDDSIVRMPSSLFSANLSDYYTNKIVRYNYPEIPGFYPSSASFLKEGNVINTRYVNYQINSRGQFLINHDGIIQSLNIKSTLSPDLTKIVESTLMDESKIGLEQQNQHVIGLEDLRIYMNADREMEFVAANTSYIKSGAIRIVKGKYGKDGLESGQILEPPTETRCEKNWIPFLGKYIYRWQPFEIGSLNEESKLAIENSQHVPNLIFDKVRGSTVPVWSEKDQCYICVVHYSESVKNAPLHYYHMLVKIQLRSNNHPVIIGWSNPFHFVRLGVQYCIGFTINEKDNSYGFWFSENDNCPGFIHNCSSCQFSFYE
jgi:hypothetical protein